ncbi:AaceriAEL278Wp [[Ashbya] aceris (nom. inval.)]|nr:AaceriAEL278Wp [[Ashbya] aceris (nom. inval.)]
MEAHKLVHGLEQLPLDDVTDYALSRTTSAGSIVSLSSVESTASSTRRKTHYCDYEGCYKAFTRPSLLTEHQQTAHQGVRAYQCEQCGRGFTKKSHLERHLFSHSETKPFSCAVCGKGVTTRQQLRRHEITHTKSFKCPHEGCGEAFYKHPQLRSHVLAVHEQKLTCMHCGKRFQRPYRLKTHMAKHHGPTSQFRYQCTNAGCVQCFETWSALQQHLHTDHPKLPCGVCGKLCVGETGLQMHMAVHDESRIIKNWKCSICSRTTYAKMADLLAHYMESHSDAIPKELIEDASNGGLAAEHAAEQHKEEADAEAARPKKRRKNSVNSLMGSLHTEEKIRKFIDSGQSGLSLLLNTAGKKRKCPYLGCSRVFKTAEKYDLHISKHKINDLKVKLLEDKLKAEADDGKGAACEE